MPRMLYQSCKLKIKNKKNYKLNDWFCIVGQYEQHNQHSQYKIHHLISPYKPPVHSKSTTHHIRIYEFSQIEYDKLTTNWTIIWQNSQNKQHSQYKIHHLFSPCKPPTFSKSTTHHSSNVDT